VTAGAIARVRLVGADVVLTELHCTTGAVEALAVCALLAGVAGLSPSSTTTTASTTAAAAAAASALAAATPALAAATPAAAAATPTPTATATATAAVGKRRRRHLRTTGSAFQPRNPPPFQVQRKRHVEFV